MNKLLTLYDIEFKRIKKVYFSILAVLIVGNISYFIYSLYDIIKSVEDILNVKGGLSLLRTSGAYKVIEGGLSIQMIYNTTYIMMTLAIIWCIYYAFAIWYKDFSNKTKVVYTLFMLPYNKFNIFISKLITIVFFIYGVLVTQHILWLIEMFIIKGISGIHLSQIIDLINYNRAMSFLFLNVSIYPVEIFVFYIIAPIVAVTVLFTAVMIHKSINKIGRFISILYILSILAIYISYSGRYLDFSDQLLLTNLIYFLSVFLLSLFLSYKLINDKVYV